MKKIILLQLFFVAQISFSYSCNCLWGGDFFELSRESDIVLKAEVIGYEKLDQNFDEILVCNVLKIYKGSTKNDTIKLRGDNGMFCAPYVSYFAIGKQYIFQFNKQDSGTPWISNCGEYYLTVNEGKVYPEEGIRKDLSQIEIMSLDDFEKKLKKTNSDVPKLIKPISIQESKKNEANKKTSIFLIALELSFTAVILILILRRKRRANKS